MREGSRQVASALLVLLCLGLTTAVTLLLPEVLAPRGDVATRLPTYVGIVGYRFEARAARPAPGAQATPRGPRATAGLAGAKEVVVDLGPASAAPTTRQPRAAARPFLALPWLDDSDPTLTLTARCTPTAEGKPPACAVSLRAPDPRARPTSAVWRLQAGGAAQTWPATPLQEGDRVVVTPRVASNADPARTLPLSRAGETWALGGCALPSDAAGGSSDRVALLDLFHTAASAAADSCGQRALTDSDTVADRWIKPTGTGGYRVPLRSFVQLDPTPQLVLLADPGFRPVTVNGQLPTPAPVHLTLAPGAVATLNVARRRFRTRRLSDATAEACAARWQPECARLDVFLVRHGLQLRVGADGSLEITLDPDSAALRQYSHIALQPSELLHEGRPVRLVYAHGTGAAARLAPLQDKPGVRELHLPFAVLGGLSYTATLRLRRQADELQIRFRDGSQAMVWDKPGRFEAGSRYHPLFEIDIARPPHDLARGLAWPFVLIALAALVAAVLGRRRHAVRRIALFVGASSALFAAAAVLHALLGYAVFSQRPWDWEAFDQLVLAGVAQPSALVLGLALGGAWVALSRRLHGRARHPGWALGAFALLVGLQLGRLGLGGHEAFGPIRVAALIPLLLAVHALWFGLAARTRQPKLRSQGWVDRLSHPLVTLLLLGLAAAAWWRDKGAMLLVEVPLVAMAALVLLRQGWTARGRLADVAWPWGRRWLPLLAVLALVLGTAALLHGTRPMMRLWQGMPLPAVDVMPTSFCVGKRRSMGELDVACHGAVVGQGASALTTMAAGGLLDPGVNRRHKIRFNDWVHDGRPGGRCHAAERLPTQAGVEVGFFRKLSHLYLSTPASERAYLRAGLVDFGRGTTNSLLDDYLAVVQAAPQFPVLTLSALCLLAALVWLLGLALTTPTAPLGASQLVVVGLTTLLFGALFLTVAANFDVWPNFAQSTPLLAVRSHSAWLLDSLAMGLLMAAYVVRCHATPKPGPDGLAANAAAPEPTDPGGTP